ncbi:hypothetical protein GOP47_0021947 [Adiantum capillus-veneris]|uniref:UNC93-like protein 3 n=1 Tax=Adiantum capillus-veneris TaxID=13818 RepID=A0A9D4Z718_ADICA|nr:hypothetical protein GOP47_0021947 [Adiantum capillus-veneris]
MEHQNHSLQSADEEPLLRGATPPSGSNSSLRDLHLLSTSFLFVFLAYSATQNLESSVNANGNLGSVSLGILYLSLTLFSVGAPFPVKWLGPKKGILVGLSGYWIFILANLFPSWYTMIPASLFLGFTASLLWVAEGTYITSAAKGHALEKKVDEESAIGSFNGVFWSYFAGTQVIGNLLSLIILHSEKGADATSTDSSFTTWPLLVTFLGCMFAGTSLACFLRPQKDPLRQAENSAVKFMSSTFGILLDKKLLLLLPLLVYSGLQQAFIWGDFTENIVTPALGVSWIGGVMAAYGAADAGASLLMGRLSSGLASASNLVFLGGVVQLMILVWLFLKQSYGSGAGGYLNIFGQAIMWGLGDASLNTQISALLGILFANETEAAFAQWKIWQSVATSFVFFATSSITLSSRITILFFVLLISVSTLSILRFLILCKDVVKCKPVSV